MSFIRRKATRRHCDVSVQGCALHDMENYYQKTWSSFVEFPVGQRAQCCNASRVRGREKPLFKRREFEAGKGETHTLQQHGSWPREFHGRHAPFEAAADPCAATRRRFPTRHRARRDVVVAEARTDAKAAAAAGVAAQDLDVGGPPCVRQACAAERE